jgi:hypothetical protein
VVTAGLTKLVDAVNQQAAVIQSAPAKGTVEGEACPTPRMVSTNPPVVATASAIHCPSPERAFAPTCNGGRSNTAWVTTAPTTWVPQ